MKPVQQAKNVTAKAYAKDFQVVAAMINVLTPNKHFVTC